MKTLILAFALLFCGCAQAKTPAASPTPARVIILAGDSLIAGDAPYIIAAMPCAKHLRGNFRDSGYMLDHIDASFSGIMADEIYVDVGAWDFARRYQPGNPLYNAARPFTLDPTNQSPVTNTTAVYGDNLVKIAAKLMRHLRPGGHLFFATTTDVPAGSAGRLPADVGVYNTALNTALRGMAGVDVDMLHSFMLPYAYLHADNNGNLIHYLPAGRQVAASHIVDLLQANGGC